jgi:hypothetical protein
MAERNKPWTERAVLGCFRRKSVGRLDRHDLCVDHVASSCPAEVPGIHDFGNDMKLVDSRDKPGHDEVAGEKRLLGLDQVFRLELVERAGLGPAPMFAL